MEIIEKAFFRAYLKRSRLFLRLFIPILFIVAMQIMMFVGHNLIIFSVALVVSLLMVFLRRALLTSKFYLHKRIKTALHDAAQEELFFSTIESELRNGLQSYTEDDFHISIFVTLTWLILITPNGCLICKLEDIQEISEDLPPSRGKFRLRVDFSDKSSFFCAYEHIYEPLVGLINKKESREGML